MYDLNTTMLGPVDLGADAILQALRNRPNRQDSCLSDTEFEEFAHTAIDASHIFGLRTAPFVGQMLHETNYLCYGGDVPCGSNNFAGLAATGGVSGASFDNIQKGVLAVAVHHMAWIYGAVENWPAATRQYQVLDERYAAVLSTGRAGTVRKIGDYTNGNWAYRSIYPVGSLDNGYAYAIRDRANELLAINAGGKVPTMVTGTGYPSGAELGLDFEPDIKPTDFNHGARDVSKIRWGVIHDTEGHYAGDVARLTQGTAGSAHAIIGRNQGEITLSVPLELSAYTAGNDELGDQALQIEFSKYPPGGDVGFTNWQYTTGAALFAWWIKQGAQIPLQFFWPHPPDADGGPLPDQPGFIGHRGVPNPDISGAWGGVSGHTDPGDDWQWERFMALVALHLGDGSAPLPQPPAVPYIVDGMDVGAGFYAVVSQLDALGHDLRYRILGTCTAGQYDGWLCTPLGGGRWKAQNVVLADFERGGNHNPIRLLWDRGRTAAPWDVRVALASEVCGSADDPQVRAILDNPDVVTMDKKG